MFREGSRLKNILIKREYNPHFIPGSGRENDWWHGNVRYVMVSGWKSFYYYGKRHLCNINFSTETYS